MSKKNLIRGAILLLLSGAFLLVLADVFEKRFTHADATHCEAGEGAGKCRADYSRKVFRFFRGEIREIAGFRPQTAAEFSRKSAFHPPSSPRAII